jgi:hypothetical protein
MFVNKIITTLTFIFFIFLILPCVSEGHDYEIKFGYFETCCDIIESNTIPMKYKNTGFRFGYIIKSKSDMNFQEYSIAYPPQKAVLGGNVVDLSNNRTSLRGRTKQARNGIIIHRYNFDEGDPIGNWKHEIYLNGNLFKTINFTVVKP